MPTVDLHSCHYLAALPHNSFSAPSSLLLSPALHSTDGVLTPPTLRMAMKEIQKSAADTGTAACSICTLYMYVHVCELL